MAFLLTKSQFKLKKYFFLTNFIKPINKRKFVKTWSNHSSNLSVTKKSRFLITCSESRINYQLLPKGGYSTFLVGSGLVAQLKGYSYSNVNSKVSKLRSRIRLKAEGASSSVDPYLILLNKVRAEIPLTKSEVDEFFLYGGKAAIRKMPPELLTDLLRNPSPNLKNSMELLKVGDVLKCDLHLKHLNIRERSEKNFIVGERIFVGDQKSLDIFNQHFLSKKVSFNLIITKNDAFFSYTDFLSVLHTGLWKSHLAGIFSFEVFLEAISLKTVSPFERQSPLVSRGVLEPGLAPFHKDTMSSRDFVFSLYSPYITGSKKSHSLKLPFIDKAFLNANSLNNATSQQGSLLFASGISIPQFIANFLSKEQTTERSLPNGQTGSFAYRMALKTQRKSSPLLYYPVSDVVATGFLSNDRVSEKYALLLNTEKTSNIFLSPTKNSATQLKLTENLLDSSNNFIKQIATGGHTSIASLANPEASNASMTLSNTVVGLDDKKASMNLLEPLDPNLDPKLKPEANKKRIESFLSNPQGGQYFAQLAASGWTEEKFKNYIIQNDQLPELDES